MYFELDLHQKKNNLTNLNNVELIYSLVNEEQKLKRKNSSFDTTLKLQSKLINALSKLLALLEKPVFSFEEFAQLLSKVVVLFHKVDDALSKERKYKEIVNQEFLIQQEKLDKLFQQTYALYYENKTKAGILSSLYEIGKRHLEELRERAKKSYLNKTIQAVYTHIMGAVRVFKIRYEKLKQRIESLTMKRLKQKQQALKKQVQSEVLKLEAQSHFILNYYTQFKQRFNCNKIDNAVDKASKTLLSEKAMLTKEMKQLYSLRPRIA